MFQAAEDNDNSVSESNSKSTKHKGQAKSQVATRRSKRQKKTAEAKEEEEKEREQKDSYINSAQGDADNFTRIKTAEESVEMEKQPEESAKAAQKDTQVKTDSVVICSKEEENTAVVGSSENSFGKNADIKVHDKSEKTGKVKRGRKRKKQEEKEDVQMEVVDEVVPNYGDKTSGDMTKDVIKMTELVHESVSSSVNLVVIGDSSEGKQESEKESQLVGSGSSELFLHCSASTISSETTSKDDASETHTDRTKSQDLIENKSSIEDPELVLQSSASTISSVTISEDGDPNTLVKVTSYRDEDADKADDMDISDDAVIVLDSDLDEDNIQEQVQIDTAVGSERSFNKTGDDLERINIQVSRASHEPAVKITESDTDDIGNYKLEEIKAGGHKKQTDLHDSDAVVNIGNGTQTELCTEIQKEASTAEGVTNDYVKKEQEGEAIIITEVTSVNDKKTGDIEAIVITESLEKNADTAEKGDVETVTPTGENSVSVNKTSRQDDDVYEVVDLTGDDFSCGVEDNLTTKSKKTIKISFGKSKEQILKEQKSREEIKRKKEVEEDQNEVHEISSSPEWLSTEKGKVSCFTSTLKTNTQSNNVFDYVDQVAEEQKNSLCMFKDVEEREEVKRQAMGFVCETDSESDLESSEPDSPTGSILYDDYVELSSGIDDDEGSGATGAGRTKKRRQKDSTDTRGSGADRDGSREWLNSRSNRLQDADEPQDSNTGSCGPESSTCDSQDDSETVDKGNKTSSAVQGNDSQQSEDFIKAMESHVSSDQPLPPGLEDVVLPGDSNVDSDVKNDDKKQEDKKSGQSSEKEVPSSVQNKIQDEFHKTFFSFTKKPLRNFEEKTKSQSKKKKSGQLETDDIVKEHVDEQGEARQPERNYDKGRQRHRSEGNRNSNHPRNDKQSKRPMAQMDNMKDKRPLQQQPKFSLRNQFERDSNIGRFRHYRSNIPSSRLPKNNETYQGGQQAAQNYLPQTVGSQKQPPWAGPQNAIKPYGYPGNQYIQQTYAAQRPPYNANPPQVFPSVQQTSADISALKASILAVTGLTVSSSAPTPANPAPVPSVTQYLVSGTNTTNWINSPLASPIESPVTKVSESLPELINKLDQVQKLMKVVKKDENYEHNSHSRDGQYGRDYKYNRDDVYKQEYERQYSNEDFDERRRREEAYDRRRDFHPPGSKGGPHFDDSHYPPPHDRWHDDPVYPSSHDRRLDDPYYRPPPPDRHYEDPYYDHPPRPPYHRNYPGHREPVLEDRFHRHPREPELDDRFHRHPRKPESYYDEEFQKRPRYPRPDFDRYDERPDYPPYQPDTPHPRPPPCRHSMDPYMETDPGLQDPYYHSNRPPVHLHSHIHPHSHEDHHVHEHPQFEDPLSAHLPPHNQQVYPESQEHSWNKTSTGQPANKKHAAYVPEGYKKTIKTTVLSRSGKILARTETETKIEHNMVSNVIDTDLGGAGSNSPVFATHFGKPVV